ncbi:MAG: toprim domain-containing protein, partial [Patescibacteria group bacterium]
ILPLRGKILNVEKARIDKMLVNKEIKSLVIAIGTAIAESFDISKLRYHKIVLMTDADVDGAHIRTLLLTLFYRYFPAIIQGGFLYIAQPPLYRLQVGKEFRYVYNDAAKDKAIAEMKKAKTEKAAAQPKKGKKETEPESGETAATEGAEVAESTKGVNIQRYKGLGEMNPDQLWETTMNPMNRMLKLVEVQDAEAADKLFDILMGEEVEPRKQFIQTHAIAVKNLDI